MCHHTGSIEDKPLIEPIKIYPNPAKDILHIDSEIPQYELSILDLSGRMIERSTHSGSATIELKRLTKGMYIFQIQSDETFSTHQVVIY